MSRLNPISLAAADEKVAQTLGRVQEMLEGDPMPEPFLIYAHVPAFLQDFYMNFKKFCYAEGRLDAQTKALLAFAVAGQAECRPWQNYFAERAVQLGAKAELLPEVMGVAAACSMYNTLFKFRDIAGTEVFGGMSVGLRAHTFQGTSLSDQRVELINVVISDLSGCKPCTSGHVSKAQALGLSDDAIYEAIQCTATIMGGIQFLKANG